MPTHRRRRNPGRRTYKKRINRKRRVVRRKILPKIVENRRLVRLVYNDTDTPTIGLTTAISFVDRIYRTNSAWDVNPSIGSTAMPGFSEWAKFYNQYRVFAVKVKCQFVNNTTTPYYCMIHLQSDAQPTSFTTWAALRQFESNTYTKTGILTPNTAKGTLTLVSKAYLPTIFGLKGQYKTDANYKGYTGGGADAGSNPPRLLNAYVIVSSVDSGNFPANANLPCRTEITMFTEFYDRIDLNS